MYVVLTKYTDECSQKKRKKIIMYAVLTQYTDE